MSKFKPTMYYKSIFDINYDLLKKEKIKVLIFDLDNTIMTVDEEVPKDDVVKLFKKLDNDFTIFIASNNFKERVRRIGDYLGVHAFYLVRKPSGKIKSLLLKKITVNMNEVAVIGDQIMTDINMGNRLGMKTILVDPMGHKDLKITFFNRLMEKIVLKVIKVKRGEYYEEVL